MDPDLNLWVGLEHVLRVYDRTNSTPATPGPSTMVKRRNTGGGMGYSYLVSSMSHFVLSLT